MLKAGESLMGPYVWGQYDLLILPPSFPYGGMENPCLTFATPTVIVSAVVLCLTCPISFFTNAMFTKCFYLYSLLYRLAIALLHRYVNKYLFYLFIYLFIFTYGRNFTDTHNFTLQNPRVVRIMHNSPTLRHIPAPAVCTQTIADTGVSLMILTHLRRIYNTSTHFTDLGKMKGWVNLTVTVVYHRRVSWFSNLCMVLECKVFVCSFSQPSSLLC